jgi:hypothetical protein
LLDITTFVATIIQLFISNFLTKNSTMKIIATLSLLLASSQAFTTTQPFGGVSRAASSLSMAADTMCYADIRKSISKLSSDNFESTLKEIEPFMLNEAGRTFYLKSVRKIGGKAKALGVDMPADFAKEAKSNAKRREKQNAFVQVKIEEAAAAAAEAAEAAAEAEAAAAAAAAEPAAEEAPVEA